MNAYMNKYVYKYTYIIGKFVSLLQFEKNHMCYKVCCSSSNKDYVSQLRSDSPAEL
jgi:hypothetical protein